MPSRVRQPAKAIARTYIRRVVDDLGNVRWESRLKLPKEKSERKAVRPTVGETLTATRRRVGIRNGR